MILPEELVGLIFDHLVADEPPLPPDTVVWENPLAPTGLACCLVSKQFLPYGRRLLYSHIDSRECREWNSPSTRPCFPELVDLLVNTPHLARIVRSCTYELHPTTVPSETEALGPLSRCTPSLMSFTLNSRLVEFEGGAEARVKHQRYFMLCETHCGVALAALVPSQLRRLAMSGWGSAGWSTILDFLGRCTKLQELDLVGVFPDEHAAAGAPLTLPTLGTLKLRHSDNAVLDFLLAAAPNLRSLFLLAKGSIFAPLETPHLALKELVTYIISTDSTVSDDVMHLANFLPSVPAVTAVTVSLASGLDSDSVPSDDASAAFLRSLPATLAHFALSGSSHAVLPTALAFQPANYAALISYSPFWTRLPSTYPANTWSPLVKVCADGGVRTGGSLRLCGLQDRLSTIIDRKDQIMMEFEEGAQEVEEQFRASAGTTADEAEEALRRLRSLRSLNELAALSGEVEEINEECAGITAEVEALFLAM